MNNRICTTILLLCLALSAQAQTLEGEDLITAGSGINQLSENIQSLLEPVGGGGEVLIGPGDDLLSTENDPNDGDSQVPVDGGLSFLLAAGAAYGARRLRKFTKENMKPKGDT